MFVNLKQLLEKLWNPGHIKEEQRGFLCLLSSSMAKKMSLNHTAVEIQYTESYAFFLQRLCHKNLCMLNTEHYLDNTLPFT